MAVEPGVQRSRRAVLAASVSGLAAAVLASAGRASPVRAGNGAPLLMGVDHSSVAVPGTPDNEATLITGISSSASPAFISSCNRGDGVGIGLHGIGATAGVLGQGDDRGVWGGGTEVGVEGSGLVGVLGYSPGGIGVKADADGGVAIEATGKVKLDRSGRAAIAKNDKSVDVAVPGGLAGAPLCFAALQARRDGVCVSSVVPNASTGKIKIRLNKVASTTASTPVAWLVLA